jgi:hypothetical protein
MMHNFGYGYGHWIGPLVCMLLLIACLVLTLVALVGLRKVKLSTTAQALWAMVILFVPILGAIAYFIVLPHEPDEA